jgi:hypothetical protein
MEDPIHLNTFLEKSYGSGLVFREDEEGIETAGGVAVSLQRNDDHNDIIDHNNVSDGVSEMERSAEGGWWIDIHFYWLRNVRCIPTRPHSDSSFGYRCGLFSFSHTVGDEEIMTKSHIPLASMPRTSESHFKRHTKSHSSSCLPALYIVEDGSLVWQQSVSDCYRSDPQTVPHNTWAHILLYFDPSSGAIMASIASQSTEEQPTRIVELVRMDPLCLWFSDSAREQLYDTRSSSPYHLGHPTWWKGSMVLGAAPAARRFTGVLSSIRQGFSDPNTGMEHILNHLGRDATPRFPSSVSSSAALGLSVFLKTMPIVSVDALLRWRPPEHQWSIPSAPKISWKPLRNDQPITLVCHDMRGGYLNDAFDSGIMFAGDAPAYSFLHWHATDIFVYFSHYRVSVPPASWTHAAHGHGVRILGTFITEWSEGAADSQLLLRDPELGARKLAEVAATQGFDGYLLNFEADVLAVHLPKLRQFIFALKAELLERVGPHSLVVWYDSVSFVDGKVRWQNEVNEHNLAILTDNLADYVFLNYHWNYKGILATVDAVNQHQISPAKVCVGIDVWGRGTPMGGQYSSAEAAQLIRNVNPNLSLALFAPAWSLESESPIWEQRSRWLQIQDPVLWTQSRRGFLELVTPEIVWQVEPTNEDSWQALPLHKGRYPPQVELNPLGATTLPVDHSAAVVIASFKSCKRRAILSVPAHFRNGIAFVELWLRGSPPNCADPYSVCVSAVTEGGKSVVLVDTGQQIAPVTGDWIRICGRSLVRDCSTIEWIEEGSDAERWRGNYGTCFSNRSVILADSTAVSRLDVASLYNYSPRIPHVRSLPWGTLFGTGVAQELFALGSQLASGVRLQSPFLQSPLPCLLPVSPMTVDEGANSTAGAFLRRRSNA